MCLVNKILLLLLVLPDFGLAHVDSVRVPERSQKRELSGVENEIPKTLLVRSHAHAVGCDV